jgi:hypothetical protein
VFLARYGISPTPKAHAMYCTLTGRTPNPGNALGIHPLSSSLPLTVVFGAVSPLSTTCYTVRGHTIDDNPSLPTETRFGSCVDGFEASFQGPRGPLDENQKGPESERGKEKRGREVMGGTRSQMPQQLTLRTNE